MGGHYTTNVDEVIQAERKHIFKSNNVPKVGLAFSGGGIRSASFALGVMQALVAKDQLRKVDYLSTVSGGGYIGSALTWFLHQKMPSWMGNKEEDYFGVERHNFPFGQKYRGNREQKEQLKPNAILDFIRQHGNYLLPGQGLSGTAMAGYVLRALSVSLAVYLCLLTCAFVILQSLPSFQKVTLPLFAGNSIVELITYNWMFTLAAALAVMLFLLGIVYSLFTFTRFGKPVWQYQLRVSIQKFIGYIIALVIVLLLLGTLPIAHHWVSNLEDWIHVSTASGTTLVGIIGVLTQYKNFLQGGSGKLGGLKIVLTAMFLLYGLALGSYWMAEAIIASQESTYTVTVLMFGVTLFVSVFVNINYLGIHRMYRDRLMETFLPNLDNVKINRWGLATEADTSLIDDMCRQPNRRPYHLINTNVVLVDSHHSKYRGRGGDSFLLSPLYCGSDATGWCHSKQYMREGGRRGMTLGTAMAISGAAVNPNAGVAGQGPTRERLVSTLLAVLNLRLGFWATHPNPEKRFIFPPNFIYPALAGGVYGGGLRESRRAIELTDGGHFENLAIYELIRRKLPVIIITDGGADPQFNFQDLANAVEKARVDFGATVEFDGGDYCLENLLPGSDEDDYFARKYNAAKNCFAVADIGYHDGSNGKLIYIKTTLIKGLPADLLGYKTAHGEFPDQSTADQFFDEQQFEAYRELGYRLGERMLDANQKHNWF